MEQVYTFNHVLVKDTSIEFLEKEFNISLKNEDDIQTDFLTIYNSSCSCEKINSSQNLNITNFYIVEDFDNDDICNICRNKQNDACVTCEEIYETKENNELENNELENNELENNELENNESEIKLEGEIVKCKIVKSLSCSHKFHYCCAYRWLLTKMSCPMCAIDWKFINNDEKLKIYYNDQIEEFELSEKVIENIGNKFNIDMEMYKITKNKKYVSEYQNTSYAICTPDMHDNSDNLKINCVFNGNTKSILIKYTTTIKELREIIANIFNTFHDQIIIFNQDKIISNDYNTLNVYNIGLKCDSIINVIINDKINYVADITDNFLVIYPQGNQESTILQNVVSGKRAWYGYPYLTNTTGISCLLSSLYILIKKVNTEEEMINLVLSNFEKYLDIYNVHEKQGKIAKEALRCLLTLDNNTNQNKNSVIITCTFYELIEKILKDNNKEIKDVLNYSNVLCNLLLYYSGKVNITYALKDVRTNKTFNIYSPLVLTNNIAPLLTFNEDLNTVVFIGKGKDVSLPIILFNPLTGNEVDVNCAELANKIGNLGDIEMVDDRVYDEGIMICIDTSNSMNAASNFIEDVMIMKTDLEQDKKKYYEILNTKKATNFEKEDIRILKDCVIWFITHPNYDDWKKHYKHFSTIQNIALCAEKSRALILLKYIETFVKLLDNKTVMINNKTYGHNYFYKNTSIQEIKYKEEPPHEYLCPITQNVMIKPTIAQDGFSYELDAIKKWFIDHNNSPMTNKKISTNLIPNNNLEIIIREWREKNQDKEQNKDQNIINLNLDDKVIQFEYNDESNVWDLKYEIYKETKYTHNEYKLSKGYNDHAGTQLIKNIKDNIEFKLDNKTIELTISNILTAKPYNYRKLVVPITFTGLNVIYKIYSEFTRYKTNKYHKIKIYADAEDSGDGYIRGRTERCNMAMRYRQDFRLCFYKKSKVYDTSKNYMSRLTIVKKLFDAFINRSIAYSFNNSIGLMSFSDKAKIECEMTPFYENFRDKKDNLYTDGNTVLLEALYDATDKLVAWKNADKEKRGNAKLRIICLTDGKNTSSKYTSDDISRKLVTNNIILDCIVIGSEYDYYLGLISQKTGGYMFNPSSIRYAFDIMELETMITSKNRDKKYSSLFGIINERTIPPIIGPKDSLEAKSTNINNTNYNDPTKIICKELLLLQKNPHPEIDIYINDDDIYFWKVLFNGPDGTPYKNGCWLAYIQFPNNYPLSPPNIRFHTPIKHCNINNYGRVCHSILDRNYTPNIGINTILHCIYGLLLNPDVSDPLDTNLALSFYEANGIYESDIMEHVKKFASKTREQWKNELE